MRKMLFLAIKRARLLRRCRRGAVAVEFAILLPLLVSVLAGTADVSHLIWADEDVTDMTSGIGDLMSQSQVTNDDSIQVIGHAGDALISPAYNNDSAIATVSSVLACRHNGAIIYRTLWSRTYTVATNRIGASEHPIEGVFKYRNSANTLSSIPTGLVTDENQTLIVTEVSFNFVPKIGLFLTSNRELRDFAFHRPRIVGRILKTDGNVSSKTCIDFYP